MNGSGRLVTDSPPYTGDLFFIEIPSRIQGHPPLVHKVSTNIHDHQRHIDLMIKAGNLNFSERRVKGES